MHKNANRENHLTRMWALALTDEQHIMANMPEVLQVCNTCAQLAGNMTACSTHALTTKGPYTTAVTPETCGRVCALC
jgi:hypothetical protein